MADKVSIKQALKQGFFQGLAASFGATLGFAVVSYVIITSLKIAGGLPLVGTFIASLVEATQIALRTR